MILVCLIAVVQEQWLLNWLALDKALAPSFWIMWHALEMRVACSPVPETLSPVVDTTRMPAFAATLHVKHCTRHLLST